MNAMVNVKNIFFDIDKIKKLKVKSIVNTQTISKAILL